MAKDDVALRLALFNVLRKILLHEDGYVTLDRNYLVVDVGVDLTEQEVLIVSKILAEQTNA